MLFAGGRRTPPLSELVAPAHLCCLACQVRVPAGTGPDAPCPCCAEPLQRVASRDALGCWLWAPEPMRIDALARVVAAVPPRPPEHR
ncbi:MAG: hypothetical protein QOF04_3316 [Solirubrobacteraceae bacterium]|nr:hypothetical protein [Solirubrobacteraceae bacterium]